MENTASIVSIDMGFAVQGVVSFASVENIRKAGEAWISQSALSTCVVDLQSAIHQDAVLFSLLLCWIRQAKKKKMMLRFKNQSPSFERMQNLFGLDRVWINY